MKRLVLYPRCLAEEREILVGGRGFCVLLCSSFLQRDNSQSNDVKFQGTVIDKGNTTNRERSVRGCLVSLCQRNGQKNRLNECRLGMSKKCKWCKLKDELFT